MHTESPSERLERALQTLWQVTQSDSQLPQDLQSTIRDLTDSLSVALQETQDAQEKLRHQAALLENISDAVVTTGLDFVVRTWNRAAQEMYGFTEEAAIGQRMRELTSIQYVDDDEEDVLREFSATGYWQGEVVQRRKDGRFVHVLASVSLIRDSSGNAIGVVAINRDITARKRAEEALRESEERFRSIAESLPIAVVITSLDDGQILYANRQYAESLGVHVSNLIGRRALEFYAQPVDRDTILSRLSLGERLKDFEIEKKRADGSRFWAVACADTIPFGGERALVTAFRDITESMRLQQEREKLLAQAETAADELRAERDLLEAVMDCTEAQIAYLDPDLNFVRVNSAYEKGCGYTKEELIGRNHFELFPYEENQAIFERVRDTGEPIEFRAKPFVFPGQPELGTTYWDWTLTPVADHTGAIQGLVLSLMDVTERERMLLQLEQERGRLKAIIDTAPLPIVVADDECRVVMTNPVADRLFALPVPYRGDWTSQALLNRCYPDGTPYDPRQLPLSRSALDGEVCRDVELTILYPDGQRQVVLASTAPIRDARGKITGAVGVFQDITERKRTREALRRYAQRLRLLHDIDQFVLSAPPLEQILMAALVRLRAMTPYLQASVSLFDHDSGDWIVLAVDSTGEPELAKGASGPLADVWYIDQLRRGETYVAADLQEATDLSPLGKLLRSMGTRSYVSVPLIAEAELSGSLNVGMDTPGEPTAEQLEIWQEIAAELALAVRHERLRHDVQRHAEQLEDLVEQRTAQLRASEARFRAVFEEAALGVALLDLEGRIVAGNRALQEMLGASAEELRGIAFSQFSRPDDAERESEGYRAFMDGMQASLQVERRCVRTDGQVLWTSLTLSRVERPLGGPLFAIAMVEDITEEKETQEALIRAEKLAITGRLAASLAHEVNNPLQAVIGCLGLAQEASAEGGAIDRYLEVGLEELRRAADVVAKLRDIQRVSEPGERKPVDLKALLEKTDTLTRKRCEERAISASFHCAEELPSVTADDGRLQQVFLNLILNATDAMGEGGELRVVARETADPQGVSIDFVDTGTGIDPDVMPRIFEPFVTTKEDGLGLGLYISQSIVQEYGGRIQAENRPGEGTSFTVWLPS